MTYQLITTNEQLNQYCIRMQNITRVTLDSEFVRTRTFYPQLGLLQLFDGNNVALIDPINITDWQALISILMQANVEKYFHACSEDVEVFLHQFNAVPLPILDSQILAAFLDNPLSSGYATLVQKYLNVELDKSETRTDWLHRPLSDKQCQYAANDVFYLFPLMDMLKAQLANKGWLSAAYEECHNAVKRRCEMVPSDKAYLNIKNAWQLRSEQLGYLQKLASWRFSYAKAHDIALNFVVHEEVLWKLARYQPTSLAELASLGLKGREVRLFGENLLAMLASPADKIEPIKRMISYPDYKQWASKIKEAASQIALETELSSELLVARRHIEQLVKWIHGELDNTQALPELISGWRGELFKPYLNL
ncbi:ribonuclease D [Orbus hercynius]|uniref:Ribonuclease D n=1 Tax=Orbus hercynius TaxID=593135 RepID=A0A495RIX3_9GAMM|nr:ribonuclease D [Orbus hercynius]RKS87483.1 ribonuclease D [Orbus hercynius]